MGMICMKWVGFAKRVRRVSGVKGQGDAGDEV
jgi:hypothetical protein